MTTFLLTAVLLSGLLFFTWWARRRRQRFLATIAVATIPNFPSLHLANRRSLVVYLPPGYSQAGQRRYKTLYLNDGQDAGILQLRETLAGLQHAGQIEPIIVVAVPTNENRLQEYGTAVSANAQELGRKAAAYSRFLTEEVAPMINGRYRTRPGPAHTAIMGASLGALSAFDIAWNHPRLFGIVGVFSGSFWWRAGQSSRRVAPGQLIMPEVVRRGDPRAKLGLPRLRAWFQAGSRDEVSDRDNNGVIDAIQDTQEVMAALTAVGYQRDEDMVYVEVKGGRHDCETWAKVLPDFLRWAFGQ